MVDTNLGARFRIPSRHGSSSVDDLAPRSLELASAGLDLQALALRAAGGTRRLAGWIDARGRVHEIAEAAVVPVVDDIKGRVPEIYVSLKPGVLPKKLIIEKLTAQQIRSRSAGWKSFVDTS